MGFAGTCNFPLALEHPITALHQTSNMRTYQIATIPGDGIGKEVVPAGVQVMQRLEIGRAHV